MFHINKEMKRKSIHLVLDHYAGKISEGIFSNAFALLWNVGAYMSTVAVAELLNVDVLHAWSTEEPSTNSCYLGADTQEKTRGVQFQSAKVKLHFLRCTLSLHCFATPQERKQAMRAQQWEEIAPDVQETVELPGVLKEMQVPMFFCIMWGVTGMTLIEILVRLMTKWFVLVGVIVCVCKVFVGGILIHGCSH